MEGLLVEGVSLIMNVVCESVSGYRREWELRYSRFVGERRARCLMLATCKLSQWD